MPYSTNFFTGDVPVSEASVYTVPASYVGVLRELDAINLYDGANILVVAITVPGLASVQFVNEALETFGLTWQWKGRLVMPAGTDLVMLSTESTIQIAACGYLLSAP